MSKRILHQTVLTVAVATGLAFTNVASAAVIAPASITHTGTATEFFTVEAHLIDGTGLSAPLASDESNLATVTHGTASAANAWVTDDPPPGGGDYYAQSGGATVIFDIDLGGAFDVDKFAYWGYGFSGTNGNSISSVTLDFYTNGTGAGAADSSQVVAVPLIFGAADISALTPTAANFIRMTVTDNHFGGPAAGGDRVGLAEIAFTGTAITPEPSTAILAVLGLLSLGMTRRRKRR